MRALNVIYVTCAALAILVTLIVVLVWIRKPMSDRDVWSMYWGSAMEIHSVMAGRGNRDRFRELCDENIKWHGELERRGLIILVRYNFADANDASEFDRVVRQFPVYRRGASLEGGQTGVGSEWVDWICYQWIPDKFKKKQ